MKFFNTTFIYNLLVWSIIIISVIICMMLISLAVTNVIYARRERKRKLYTDKYIDLISSYITGTEIKIEPITDKFQYEVLADVCDNVLIDISGQQAERVINLLHSLGVVDYYKEMAHSESWVKKYIAIEKLEFFRDRSLKDFFISLIEEKFNNEKIHLKLITALSFIADIESLRLITIKLTEMLHNENILSAKIIEHIYTNAIKSLRQINMEAELVKFIDEIKLDKNIPLIIKRDILIACGATHLVEANKTIMSYFYDINDIEIKASAIKTLGKIGLPESKSVILKAIYDESWIIRLAASKAASSYGTSAINDLKNLLKDPEYYVRLNAAKSLAATGDEGIKILMNEEESDNAFVRNTVKYVLDLNILTK